MRVVKTILLPLILFIQAQAFAADSQEYVTTDAPQTLSNKTLLAPVLKGTVVSDADLIFRLGGALHTAPTTIGPTPPATCAIGDQHFKTGVPASEVLMGCLAPDTWATIGGGGGVGSDDQIASEVPFTPTGNIAANDVQGAIQELDTEKFSQANANAIDFVVGTATGAITGERVATDTATIDVDIGTAGQAKWNVVGNSIGPNQIDETANFAWSGTQDFTGATLLGEIDTLDTVMARGNTTDNCTQTDKCQFGNGNVFWDIYCDDVNVCYFETSVAGDFRIRARTGHKIELYDEEGATPILTFNPGAATQLDKYLFAPAHRPKKTVVLTADSFYMQGSCALNTTLALISGGLIEPYITCTDSNSDGFHRSYKMPKSWDGGTLTFEVGLTNVNASPANDFEIDFSASCVPLGTAIATTISTTGEQPVNVDFDAGGTCGGSACVQNALVKKISAAVTPNGTCAGGNLLRIQGQIDATATTTTQVANVKIVDVTMEYTVVSLSD